MNLVFVHPFGEFITHQIYGFRFYRLFVLLYFLCYYFKWHPCNTLNERAFTHALKITILNFMQILRKKYLLKFIFSKDAVMINLLIHGGKKGHIYLKKVAAES